VSGDLPRFNRSVSVYVWKCVCASVSVYVWKCVCARALRVRESACVSEGLSWFNRCVCVCVCVCACAHLCACVCECL